jgi:hypothetical protein
MWRYAFYLTGNNGASILAGIVFAFIPYRFDHMHHLELQATIFLPLTLLYFERTLETGSRRDASLMMAWYVAEVFSCIYYSIFITTALAPIAVVRCGKCRRMRAGGSSPAIMPAAIVGLIVVAPYAYAYTLNRVTLGDRLESDIRLYSATLGNYLATTAANVMHGGWSAHFGSVRTLFVPWRPGDYISGLGLYSFDRRRATLVTVGAIGFVISLGLNTPFYQLLRALVLPYRGLRAPARASILVFLALGALGAYGWTRADAEAIEVSDDGGDRLHGCGFARRIPDDDGSLADRSVCPADVYKWLAGQPRVGRRRGAPSRAPMSSTSFTTASTCSTARGTGNRSSTVTAGSFPRASSISPNKPRPSPMINRLRI